MVKNTCGRSKATFASNDSQKPVDPRLNRCLDHKRKKNSGGIVLKLLNWSTDTISNKGLQTDAGDTVGNLNRNYLQSLSNKYDYKDQQEISNRYTRIRKEYYASSTSKLFIKPQAICHQICSSSDNKQQVTCTIGESPECMKQLIKNDSVCSEKLYRNANFKNNISKGFVKTSYDQKTDAVDFNFSSSNIEKNSINFVENCVIENQNEIRLQLELTNVDKFKDEQLIQKYLISKELLGDTHKSNVALASNPFLNECKKFHESKIGSNWKSKTKTNFEALLTEKLMKNELTSQKQYTDHDLEDNRDKEKNHESNVEKPPKSYENSKSKILTSKTANCLKLKSNIVKEGFSMRQNQDLNSTKINSNPGSANIENCYHSNKDVTNLRKHEGYLNQRQFSLKNSPDKSHKLVMLNEPSMNNSLTVGHSKFYRLTSCKSKQNFFNQMCNIKRKRKKKNFYSKKLSVMYFNSKHFKRDVKNANIRKFSTLKSNTVNKHLKVKIPKKYSTSHYCCDIKINCMENTRHRMILNKYENFFNSESKEDQKGKDNKIFSQSPLHSKVLLKGNNDPEKWKIIKTGSGFKNESEINLKSSEILSHENYNNDVESSRDGNSKEYLELCKDSEYDSQLVHATGTSNSLMLKFDFADNSVLDEPFNCMKSLVDQNVPTKDTHFEKDNVMKARQSNCVGNSAFNNDNKMYSFCNKHTEKSNLVKVEGIKKRSSTSHPPSMLLGTFNSNFPLTSKIQLRFCRRSSIMRLKKFQAIRNVWMKTLKCAQNKNKLNCNKKTSTFERYIKSSFNWKYPFTNYHYFNNILFTSMHNLKPFLLLLNFSSLPMKELTAKSIVYSKSVEKKPYNYISLSCLYEQSHTPFKANLIKVFENIPLRNTISFDEKEFLQASSLKKRKWEESLAVETLETKEKQTIESSDADDYILILGKDHADFSSICLPSLKLNDFSRYSTNVQFDYNASKNTLAYASQVFCNKRRKRNVESSVRVNEFSTLNRWDAMNLGLRSCISFIQNESCGNDSIYNSYNSEEKQFDTHDSICILEDLASNCLPSLKLNCLSRYSTNVKSDNNALKNILVNTNQVFCSKRQERDIKSSIRVNKFSTINRQDVMNFGLLSCTSFIQDESSSGSIFSQSDSEVEDEFIIDQIQEKEQCDVMDHEKECLVPFIQNEASYKIIDNRKESEIEDKSIINPGQEKEKQQKCDDTNFGLNVHIPVLQNEFTENILDQSACKDTSTISQTHEKDFQAEKLPSDFEIKNANPVEFNQSKKSSGNFAELSSFKDKNCEETKDVKEISSLIHSNSCETLNSFTLPSNNICGDLFCDNIDEVKKHDKVTIMQENSILTEVNASKSLDSFEVQATTVQEISSLSHIGSCGKLSSPNLNIVTSNQDSSDIENVSQSCFPSVLHDKSSPDEDNKHSLLLKKEHLHQVSSSANEHVQTGNQSNVLTELNISSKSVLLNPSVIIKNPIFRDKNNIKKENLAYLSINLPPNHSTISSEDRDSIAKKNKNHPSFNSFEMKFFQTLETGPNKNFLSNSSKYSNKLPVVSKHNANENLSEVLTVQKENQSHLPFDLSVKSKYSNKLTVCNTNKNHSKALTIQKENLSDLPLDLSVKHSHVLTSKNEDLVPKKEKNIFSSLSEYSNDLPVISKHNKNKNHSKSLTALKEKKMSLDLSQSCSNLASKDKNSLPKKKKSCSRFNNSSEKKFLKSHERVENTTLDLSQSCSNLASKDKNSFPKKKKSCSRFNNSSEKKFLKSRERVENTNNFSSSKKCFSKLPMISKRNRKKNYSKSQPLQNASSNLLLPSSNCNHQSTCNKSKNQKKGGLLHLSLSTSQNHSPKTFEEMKAIYEEQKNPYGYLFKSFRNLTSNSAEISQRKFSNAKNPSMLSVSNDINSEDHTKEIIIPNVSSNLKTNSFSTFLSNNTVKDIGSQESQFCPVSCLNQFPSFMPCHSSNVAFPRINSVPLTLYNNANMCARSKEKKSVKVSRISKHNDSHTTKKENFHRYVFEPSKKKIVNSDNLIQKKLQRKSATITKKPFFDLLASINKKNEVKVCDVARTVQNISTNSTCVNLGNILHSRSLSSVSMIHRDTNYETSNLKESVSNFSLQKIQKPILPNSESQDSFNKNELNVCHYLFKSPTEKISTTMKEDHSKKNSVNSNITLCQLASSDYKNIEIKKHKKIPVNTSIRLTSVNSCSKSNLKHFPCNCCEPVVITQNSDKEKHISNLSNDKTSMDSSNTSEKKIVESVVQKSDKKISFANDTLFNNRGSSINPNVLRYDVFKSNCKYNMKNTHCKKNYVTYDDSLFKKNGLLHMYYDHVNGLLSHKVDLSCVTKKRSDLSGDLLEAYDFLYDQLSYHESLLHGLVHKASQLAIDMTDTSLNPIMKIVEQLDYIAGYQLACKALLL